MKRRFYESFTIDVCNFVELYYNEGWLGEVAEWSKALAC